MNYGALYGRWQASPKSNAIKDGHVRQLRVYGGIFWNATEATLPNFVPQYMLDKN